MNGRIDSEGYAEVPDKAAPIVAPQHQKGGRETNPPPRPNRMPFIAGGAAVVAIAVFALSRLGGASASPPPTPLPAAIIATSTPAPSTTPLPPTAIPATPTAAGPAIGPYEAMIQTSAQSGRWSDAARTAESALAVPDLRDTDRKLLTQYAVTYGLKALYTEPFRPHDVEQHQRMIDTYLSLKKRANDAAITIDTPLQVASTAYASSQFQLARVALEEGLKEKAWQPDIDRDITKLYVSVLYGWGYWYTTAPTDSPLYQEGLRWLSSARIIAEKYETGQADAYNRLGQLVGWGRIDSVTPMPTPLLP